MRPCTCDRTVVGEPFRRGRDCGRCWLWHNDPDNPTVRAWKAAAAPPPPKPVALWPPLARALARLRDPADRGLGDTAERRLGRLGRLYKRLFERLTGRPCGCADRRAALNRAFPYPGSGSDQ